MPMQLSSSERELLEVLVCDENTDPRLSQRIHVILLAAAGVTNRKIALETGLHYTRVGLWRQRYASHGLAGLGDRERSGRPAVYGVETSLEIMRVLGSPPPDSYGCWTIKLLADEMAGLGTPISVSQLWRLCVGLDLMGPAAPSWALAQRNDHWFDAGELCSLGLTESLRSIVFVIGQDAPALRAKRVASRLIAGTAGLSDHLISELSLVGLGPAVVAHAGLDRAGHLEALLLYLQVSMDRIGKDAILYCVVSGAGSEVDEISGLAAQSGGRVSFHHSTSDEHWLNQAQIVTAVHDRCRSRHRNSVMGEGTDRLIQLYTDPRNRPLAFWWEEVWMAVKSSGSADRDRTRENTTAMEHSALVTNELNSVGQGTGELIGASLFEDSKVG